MVVAGKIHHGSYESCSIVCDFGAIPDRGFGV